MKEDINILFERVQNGTLTPEEATDKLLEVIIESVPKGNPVDQFNKASDEVEAKWGYSGLSDTMYEEYARACFRFYFTGIILEK